MAEPTKTGNDERAVPDRVCALAFNELSAALKDVDRFVPLTGRLEIARRVVAVVRAEVLRGLGLHPEQIAERENAPGRPDSPEQIRARSKASALRIAAEEIEQGLSALPSAPAWLRRRARQIEEGSAVTARPTEPEDTP